VGSSVSCPDSEVVNVVLDGEAEPSEKAGYERHLEQCEECRKRHQFYSQLRNCVRTSCQEERCPELVEARLRKALGAKFEAESARVAPSASRRGMVAWGGVAAACAALFSFVALRPAADKATPLALSLSQDHTRCCSIPAVGQPPSPASLAESTYGAAMPEMAGVRQLQPYDVRVCPVLDGQRAIHVLCRDPQQRVFSMYALPRDRVENVALGEDGPRVYDARDNRVAAWEHKGWLFSLVSEAPGEELASLAGACEYECSPQRLVNSPIRALPVMHTP